MRFALIAEGPADAPLVVVLSRLCHSLGALDVQGELGDERLRLLGVGRKIANKVTALLDLDPDFDLLFIHMDGDSEGLAERRSKIDQAMAQCEAARPYVRVVPVRMTESWLLADEKKIRTAAGFASGQAPLELPKPARIETVSGVKNRLRTALSRARRPTKHAKGKLAPLGTPGVRRTSQSAARRSRYSWSRHNARVLAGSRQRSRGRTQRARISLNCNHAQLLQAPHRQPRRDRGPGDPHGPRARLRDRRGPRYPGRRRPRGRPRRRGRAHRPGRGRRVLPERRGHPWTQPGARAPTRSTRATASCPRTPTSPGPAPTRGSSSSARRPKPSRPWVTRPAPRPR